MTKTNQIIDALNTISNGWTESRPGALLCNPNAGGGIIDSEIVSGEWFVIFNDGRATLSGYESRDDAVEAFAIASRSDRWAPPAPEETETAWEAGYNQGMRGPDL